MSGSYRPMRETNDPEQKAIVSESVAHRGTIVSAYAHIEFLLADVCMKAWQLPEYAHLRGRPFPYKAESRIKAADALFKSEGRLNSYYSDVEPMFPHLLRYEELRHFMAHGLMVVKPGTFPPFIQVQLWRPAKDGPEIGTMDTDLNQIRDAAHELALYSNTLIKVFHRVYIEQGLEL